MNELLNKIQNAIDSLECYIDENHVSRNSWPYKDIGHVLNLYKNKITENKEIETRLLRAMKDVFVVSYRNFEGTNLHTKINSIDDELRDIFKNYIVLEPLGLEFGKGDPI